MTGVGFELRPPLKDQNTRYHLDGKGISPRVWRLRPLGYPCGVQANQSKIYEV